MADGRRRGARAAAAPAGRAARGWTRRIVDVVRARRGARRCPALPRGDGWLFVETAGDTEAEARAAAAAARRRRRLPGLAGGHRRRPSAARCGGSARTAPGWPAAPRPARRRWPGWEDAAVPPEQLGALPARLRRAAEPSTAWTACPTGTSATAACTCASTSRSIGAGGRPRYRAFVERRGATLVGALRRLDVGRARRRPGPQRAAAAHVLARSHRAVRPRSRRSSTRATCSTRACSCDPAPLDADLRVAAGSRRCRRGLGFAYAPRRRRPRRRGAPLHRRRQVPGRHHRHRRGDVPVLPGHPRREGLHPRPGPGAAGDAPTARLVAGLGGRRRSPRRSTCACPARAARRDCPTGVDMATYKAEVLYQRYRRRLRPPLALRAGLAAALGPARRRGRPGWPTPCCALRGLAAAGQAVGRGRPAPRPLPTFARADVPQLVRGPARAGRSRRRAGRCCGSTRSPTTSRRRSAGPRCGCSRRPGYAVQVTGRAGVLRPDLDLHRPARRRAPAAAAQPATRWTRRSTPASRSSASSRRARPCCAATPPSCCRTTRARPGSRPRRARWPSC